MKINNDVSFNYNYDYTEVYNPFDTYYIFCRLNYTKNGKFFSFLVFNNLRPNKVTKSLRLIAHENK